MALKDKECKQWHGGDVGGNDGAGAWLEPSDLHGPAGHSNLEGEKIRRGRSNESLRNICIQNSVMLRMARKIQDGSKKIREKSMPTTDVR